MIGEIKMNVQEKSDKLAEILQNEDVMTKIANSNTKEEMQSIFFNNGLEMTIEEIDVFIKFMNSDEAGEVSECELDSVSGGSFTVAWIFSQACTGIKKVAKPCWNAGRWFANNVG